MKRIALVTVILAVTACSKAGESPAGDTTTPAMSPAPADTGLRMMDSMRIADSIRMADSIKAAGTKAGTKGKRP